MYRRQSIIEQVWDIHFEYNSSVIDVYMNTVINEQKGLGELRSKGVTSSHS